MCPNTSYRPAVSMMKYYNITENGLKKCIRVHWFRLLEVLFLVYFGDFYFLSPAFYILYLYFFSSCATLRIDDSREHPAHPARYSSVPVWFVFVFTTWWHWCFISTGENLPVFDNDNVLVAPLPFLVLGKVTRQDVSELFLQPFTTWRCLRIGKLTTLPVLLKLTVDILDTI